MIRFYIFMLLALVVGTVLYVLLGDDPGYVLVSFGEYSVETSLLLTVLLLILLGLVIYVFFRLVRLLVPWQWLRNRGLDTTTGHADRATLEGLRLLAHGNPRSAYKLLLEQAKHSRSPVLNYLGACVAAWQLGDRAGMKFSLNQAEKIAGKSSLPVSTLKARFAMSSDEQEQALAILLELHKQYPDNPGVLLSLSSALQAVGDWQQLATILPALERNRVLDADKLATLRIKVVAKQLQSFNEKRGSVGQLNAIWDAVSNGDKNNETLLALYIQKLIALDEDDRAQVLLIRFFKHSWSDTLVRMVGYIDTRDPAQQLLLLEKLMQDRPGNAMLAMTLGRVSLRNRLWGKAKEYFEAALVFSTDEKISAETNAELGRLLEHMGEGERSAVCYKKAMALLDVELPDLPYPGLS